MSYRSILRRWSHPIYWRAHRQSWPTRQDVLVFLLCFVAIGSASLIGHAYTMRLVAEGAQEQRAEILACLNGKTSLGTYHSHGAKWEVLCETYERKVK
jgi:hypothetical protein